MTYYDQLYAYVAEVEGSLHQRQAVIQSFDETKLTTRVPNGWGTVTVSGTGRLLAVDIPPRTAAVTTGKALGKALVQAILDAEAAAAAHRDSLL